jgi:hypothetical protein
LQNNIDNVITGDSAHVENNISGGSDTNVGNDVSNQVDVTGDADVTNDISNNIQTKKP